MVDTPPPSLRVAVVAFGQVFYKDELSVQAWAELLELVQNTTKGDC